MTIAAHHIDLAIVAMDLVSPSGEGIAYLASRLYHGLQWDEKPLENSISGKMIAQICQRVMRQSGCATGHGQVITLAPDLKRTLQDAGLDCPILDLSAAPQPLVDAIMQAADTLDCGEADVVMLVDQGSNPNILSAVLLTTRSYARDNAKPVYATFTAVAATNTPFTSLLLAETCRKALKTAGIDARKVGLLGFAFPGGSTSLQEEIQGLLAAYPGENERNCALVQGTAGLLGLIELACCIHRRIIPKSPSGNSSQLSETLERSGFDIPFEPRTWFLPPAVDCRSAALDCLTAEGLIGHILLQEEERPYAAAPEESLVNESLYLFPFAATSIDHFAKQMTDLEIQILAGIPLATIAKACYVRFLGEQVDADLRLCLLGHNKEELLREIGFAVKGLPTALAEGTDWQTLVGSYFTPLPLARTGEIAFVYPGGFNSYPSAGRDLFYLYPGLHQQIAAISDRIGDLLSERKLYPRSVAPISAAELKRLEAELTLDPLTMLISGTSLALLYTLLLRDIFSIHPSSAFGYSLGEISMLFASGVWTNGDQAGAQLRSSALFQTRLAGPQNAIREFWNIPEDSQDQAAGALWENDILLVEVEKVLAALEKEPRVFLTHINAPRQVVIGGEPAACKRVIAALKCSALQAPFNYALHCPAMHSAYPDLAELLSWPVMGKPDERLYAAATFKPVPFERQAIAQQVAQGLCSRLDFPRLIRQVYADGARIFIELGAGGNCTHWVDDTLKEMPHLAYQVNRKGIDDHTSILRLLARLICHYAPVNLKPLYSG